MAGVKAQAALADKIAGALEAVKLVNEFIAAGVGVFAGVEFDGVETHVLGGFDLPLVRVDEGGDENVLIAKTFDDAGDALGLAKQIEAALGGDFFAFFGDEG